MSWLKTLLVFFVATILGCLAAVAVWNLFNAPLVLGVWLGCAVTVFVFVVADNYSRYKELLAEVEVPMVSHNASTAETSTVRTVWSSFDSEHFDSNEGSQDRNNPETYLKG